MSLIVWTPNIQRYIICRIGRSQLKIDPSWFDKLDEFLHVNYVYQKWKCCESIKYCQNIFCRLYQPFYNWWESNYAFLIFFWKIQNLIFQIFFFNKIENFERCWVFYLPNGIKGCNLVLIGVPKRPFLNEINPAPFLALFSKWQKLWKKYTKIF